ncbi:MAG: hypothetical protein ACRCV9_04055 [Burkholderiaceae bacterium]
MSCNRKTIGKPLKDLSAWPKRLHASTLKFNHAIKGEAAAKKLGPAKKKSKREPIVHVLPSVRHDPRYQCAEGERVYGAGFAAVGVGRNVETGRPWSDES